MILKPEEINQIFAQAKAEVDEARRKNQEPVESQFMLSKKLIDQIHAQAIQDNQPKKQPMICQKLSKLREVFHLNVLKQKLQKPQNHTEKEF